MTILSSMRSYMSRLQAVKIPSVDKGRTKRQILCEIHSLMYQEMDVGPVRTMFAKQTPASWSDAQIDQAFKKLRAKKKEILALIKQPTG